MGIFREDSELPFLSYEDWDMLIGRHGKLYNFNVSPDDPRLVLSPSDARKEFVVGSSTASSSPPDEDDDFINCVISHSFLEFDRASSPSSTDHPQRKPGAARMHDRRWRRLRS